VIFAIATILVRDNEVVAVGVSGRNVIAMQQQEETASSEANSADDEPDSADDRPDSANDRQLNFMPEPFDEDLDCHSVCADSISAVMNSREDDTSTYEFPDGRCCILVSNGKPLLEQQWKDDVWQRFHAQR
jgi:hypothetical protein